MSDDRAIDDVLRRLAPQVLGAVVRKFGDFDGSEDAVQEALLAAATRWPANGMPENPGGWLYRVAARRMIDHIRSDAARRAREDVVAGTDAAGPEPAGAQDESLSLLFMCCHPVLSPATAIPLTLRAVGGLTTAEIARAFLVPEATMAQRISRAKQKIQASDVPFGMPTTAERDERLRSVLRVLYLMFNEGYASSGGPDLARVELSSEAIRLTRAVHASLPTDPEVAGLLALMLLNDARRNARTGPAGELIPLDEQDRSRWDPALIGEGTTIISAAIEQGEVGEYQLQALIAATHDQAERAEDTDWAHILSLYLLLERMTGNPMVALNRAIAAAMVHGPDAGLELLTALDGPLKGHYRLDAVRGHLHELAGHTDQAIEHYRIAARRTTSTPERNYLTTQAARLASGTG